MTRVLLGVGSNTERGHHLKIALDWLRENFPSPCFSSVYESAAIGFEGRAFYNLVVAIETDISLGELAARIKALEYTYGREPNAPRFASRNIDIDILTYGDTVGVCEGIELPRGEILHHAFVLGPLAELVGDSVHPEVGKSYAQLWSEFDRDSQELRAVPYPGTPSASR